MISKMEAVEINTPKQSTTKIHFDYVSDANRKHKKGHPFNAKAIHDCEK